MTEYEHQQYVDKAPGENHRALSKYIADTTGKKVSPAVAALVLRLYPLYLKSPAVEEAKAAEAARREAEKAAKERAKKEAALARLAKIEEQRKALLAELGIEESTDDPNSAPAEEEVAEVVPLKKAAPKKAAPKKAKKAPEPEPEAEVFEEDDEFVDPSNADFSDAEDEDENWDDEDDEEDF